MQDCPSRSFVWSSRGSNPIIGRKMCFLTKILYWYLAIGIAVAEDDSSTTTKNTSLEISTHDLMIKVGTSQNVYLTPTDSFNASFEGALDAVLEFQVQYDVEGVIAHIPGILLVVNGTQTFSNTSVEITAISAGKVIVLSDVKSVPALNLTVDNIFLRVTTYKSSILLIVADIVGWIYFLAWSISFYPQIYQNWRRKSVRGLSFDFVFLNVTGFFVYGIFNISLYWIPEIQKEYVTKYPTGEIPVQINDVIFTLHAILASGMILIQCLIYDRGSQTVSNTGRTLLMFIYTFVFVMLVVALSNNAITWLAFLTVCSYVKLFITLIKYLPQAYMNWSRKSTSGWCIGNVLLDFTGGIFSLTQMLITGYNHNDWLPLLTDFTKFGLGFFSICFDILFIIQHYYLYRNHEAYEPLDGNTPIDPYEDMVTSNNVIDDDELERLSHSSTSSTASFPKQFSSSTP